MNYFKVLIAKILRSETIQDAEKLSKVTDELRDNFAEFFQAAGLSGNIMEQYQQHLRNVSREFKDDTKHIPETTPLKTPSPL